MLHSMFFYLSGKIVAIHLDISTAKGYICNLGGTVSHSLSKLACHILNLTNKHCAALMQHTYLTLSVWKLIISCRQD